MPEELYNNPSPRLGTASGWQGGQVAGQQEQSLQGMNDDTKAYIETLAPEERQKAIDDFNAPLTGMEVYEALKQSPDFKPTHDEYTRFLAYDKEHKSSILAGLAEGAGAVMGDLGNAVGAMADHPLTALSKAPASLIEAFAQGTRNLYGMVAQSASPDSVLFKMKNALAGDGTVDGYNQFLEARKFNKHSAAIAAGKETLVMDKDVIDHDLTLAMSYIADPTLFVPFGTAATAGMKAVGLGEKLAMLGGRASMIKAAVIGGGLKWGVGAPIEAIAGVTRGTIERAASVGGAVLETTTGISAAELKATARLSAAGTTTASALGGHIPVVSDISNVYVAAGAGRGFGEAISAVGEQIQKRGFKRGHESFAREALEQTAGLSPHAKGLLKVLDAIDPMMSYGYGTAVGMGHGAAIGGVLGYLNAGEEGLGHGMGAGIALGGVGSVAGRMFADVTGGTKMARAEVQGGFVIESMRADKHQNLPAVEYYLELATRSGDRAGALQVIGGLDRIAPDMRLILGNTASQKKLLQSKGLNADGHKVDKVTGQVEMRNGKPVQYEAPLAGFYGGEGFTMHTERLGDGKQEVTVVINTDALAGGSKNVMHHELFHAVFKTTIMEKMFRQGFSEAILGKFNDKGIKIKDAEINPKEFRAFVARELANTVDTTTNKKLAPAELAKRLREFDAHLAEYQKAGTTTKMSEASAKKLDYLVEEFGAHYATQFMKGKPVDYLFRGAEYTGMQGVMDRLHNGFLDFWQGQTGRQNPTFGDFTSKGFDASFGPNKGKRTLDQRSPALDYMVQDLLRSVAGKRKGSTNSFDVRSLSPEARNAYFNSSGMDGVRAYYDKDGNLRNVTEAQIRTERLQVGKAIHESLSKLDPKETAGLADSDGNFGASSTLGTKFNDTVLAHLVKEGHISQQLAERIKTVQDIVSGKGSNRVSYLYKGASYELEVGPNSPRLYGKDVPITARETIVVGYSIKIKKDGGLSLVMKGLDAKIIDARGNIQWAKPEVRALWQGDRNAFDQSFFEYLSNASKASTDRTRVESSLLPLLARGDGLGGERRNVMHQFLGMAKRKDAGYFNMPIAEIPRGKTSVVTNFTMDTMSPMQSNSPLRYDFNLDNAHSDLSRNFKVSDMEHEATPQGNVFTHASGFKIIADKDGASKLYDSRGQPIGAFKNKDIASNAMEKAYVAERAETEVRIERIKEDQQKQQQNFKVWDDKTMEEGRRLGDIFETEAGKAFHHGTNLIRQTREEFYSDNFTKLRQADPNTVMQVTEQIAQRGYQLRELRTQAYDRLQAELAKGKGREYKKARDQYDVIVSHADRYNDILLAYERATRAKTNGQGILDYINTHRRTSTGYDNMAKVFFGDHYDSQFQTGKAVTTVATHGTSSHELLASREFDPKQSGSKHGAEHDKVGIFLSGETKTSFGYADPKEGGFGYRQVRAAVKFNNPLVVDAEFKCYSPEIYEGYMKKVRDGGHDGVIIKNVYDGGSADTVFIINNESVKENTAIIDTHIGMERVTRQSEQMGSVSADSDQGSVRYPIQESMPRGKGVRIGSDLGLSFKVGDELTLKEKEQLKIVRETIPMLHPALWEELKKSGFVIKNFDPRQITGEVLVLNPDPMIVGNVRQGKDAIVQDALGGSLFPAGENARAGNELWANAQGTAKLYNRYLTEIYDRKVASLNERARAEKWSKERLEKEAANITTHIILTKGSPQKVLSNPTAFKGSTTLLQRFVKEGIVSEKAIKQKFQLMSERREAVKAKDDGSHLDAKGERITERVHADTTNFKDIMELPLNEFLAEVNRRAAISFETRGDLIKDTLKALSEDIDVKKPKSLAKMRAMFDDPKFDLKKNSNLGDAFALRFGEPYTDNLKPSDAHTSISYKGKTKVVKGSHPDYPWSIVSEGAGKPTIHMFSDAIPIEQLVDKTIDANPERIDKKTGKVTPANDLYFKDVKDLGAAGANKLGTNVTGVSKAKMKALKDLPVKPAGEGRIDMNYKVADTKVEHIAEKRRELLKDLPRYRQMIVEYRDKLLSGEEGKDLLTKTPGRSVYMMEHIKGVEKMLATVDGAIKDNSGSFFQTAAGEMDAITLGHMFGHEEFANTPYQPQGGHMEKYKGFDRYLEKELTRDYAKPTFYSALNQTVEKIFSKTVGKDEAINPARLLNLIKSASGGDVGRIMTEADAIGLTEFLKSKGQKKTSIKEIRDFIDTNKIEIEVDQNTRGVDADFGDTSSYRAKGDIQEYHTFIARINPEYAHGVGGHFDKHSPTKTKGDVVVHIRATIRVDAEGKRVLFVEEIQSQNAQAKQVPPLVVKQVKKDVAVMTEFRERMKNSRDAYQNLQETTPFGEGQAKIKTDFIKETKELYNKYFKELPETYRNKLRNDYEMNVEVLGKEEGENTFFNNLDVGKSNDYGQSKDNQFNMLLHENKLKLSRAEDKGTNAPLQDFKETVKIASRTAMRQAVELGADRVVFVESKDTHPDVDMRNERGIQLYDKDIPAMVASDIKKFGGELKPADNFTNIFENGAEFAGDLSQIPSEGKRKTFEILSNSRGYDVTPAMKETLQGQPTYKVSDTDGAARPAKAKEGTPDLSPFEGKFKVSDSVQSGVAKLDEVIGRLASKDNLSPTIRDAMFALKDAVRKQNATDEFLVPELREAYDVMVRSIDDQLAGASLTPVEALKEIQRVLKPLDKKIKKNSERIKQNALNAQEANMAEGADVESQTTADRRTTARRDMEEGASLESDQVTAEIDRQRGENRLDQEEGASLESDEATGRIAETVQDLNDGADIEANQPRNQNLPPQFPYPAPATPEGLPRPTPSGKPAFPRPPTAPALPTVKPSGAVPFPRPPATPALPRGSIAPPPPQGTPPPKVYAPPSPFDNVPPSKPISKIEGWRGWTLEKGLNGGFWKNAVGWMIIVQADKFKVYNPQKAMMGIYQDLDQAKRRVQRAEPKQ